MSLARLGQDLDLGSDAIDEYRPAATTLLTDFAACVLHGRASVAVDDWPTDGTVGLVALMALRAHAQDRDDIDWPTLTHPGSIIWPVTIGLGAGGELAMRAAAVGYEVMTTVAGMLRDVSPRWHLTSLAGHAGAAAAAATVFELDPDAVSASIGLALSVAGGVAATSAQHTNATGWHRAAAAVTGLQAARSARAGYAPPADLLEAANGALAAFGSDNALAGAPESVSRGRATISRASVRLYATNGLSQAAVRAAARVGRELGHCPVDAEIALSPVVAAATAPNGPGGTWWDTTHACAVALATGNEWALEDPASVQAALSTGLAQRIRVDASTTELLAARVMAEGHDVMVAKPPGSDLMADAAEIEQKWTALRVRDEAVRIAGLVLADETNALSELLPDAFAQPTGNVTWNRVTPPLR